MLALRYGMTNTKSSGMKTSEGRYSLKFAGDIPKSHMAHSVNNTTTARITTIHLTSRLFTIKRGSPVSCCRRRGA